MGLPCNPVNALGDRSLGHNFDLNKGPIHVSWFLGGRTNICYNALDRHVLAGHGDRIALYWEGNDPQHSSTVTYKQLLDMVRGLVGCVWYPAWH